MKNALILSALLTLGPVCFAQQTEKYPLGNYEELTDTKPHDGAEVWNNGFKEYRNREWARKGQCADCDMFRYCEGSGMHLHDDSGDLITCHYRRIEN